MSLGTLLRKAFIRKEKKEAPQGEQTASLAFRDDEDYVKRCLNAEYQDGNETRIYNSEPAFAGVLSHLNAQEYAKVISAGKKTIPLYPDFDLLYKWAGSAYRSMGQFDNSRAVLTEGLKISKRKCLLLTDLGETEWQSGNLEDAVYYLSQALHCLSAKAIDYNAYLLLSYIAKAAGLHDLGTALLARVDDLRAGQVRLSPQSAQRLSGLTQAKKTGAVIKVLAGLESRYFAK